MSRPPVNDAELLARWVQEQGPKHSDLRWALEQVTSAVRAQVGGDLAELLLLSCADQPGRVQKTLRNLAQQVARQLPWEKDPAAALARALTEAARLRPIVLARVRLDEVPPEVLSWLAEEPGVCPRCLALRGGRCQGAKVPCSRGVGGGPARSCGEPGESAWCCQCLGLEPR